MLPPTRNSVRLFLRPMLLGWLLTVTTCLLLGSTESFAATDNAEAVEAGKKAFVSTSPPWYDVESDSLKPLKVKATKEEERQDWKREGPRWTWDWSWWPDFSFLGQFMRLLGWTLLIGLIALIAFLLVRALMNIEATRTAAPKGLSAEEEAKLEAARIENLPTRVRPKKGNFLDFARDLYQQGKFGEAIVYLFSHRLLQLDRAGCIRLTKGKTNRQYLTEIDDFKELQKILGQTIVPFEDVFFGKHSLTKERFERCWSSNDQFEQHVRQVSM